MIYFRDMTFCSFWKECQHGGSCGRALTAAVRRAAKERGLPVCRFLKKPGCFDVHAAEAAKEDRNA